MADDEEPQPGEAGALCPNVESAYVQPSKLEAYLLDPDHPVGRHKARVFASALGVTREDSAWLAALLVQGVRSSPVTGVRSSRGGPLYEVVVSITNARGASNEVTTVWQLDESERPRLVTAYVRR